MTDLDQSPAQPFDYVSRGPTFGWQKNYNPGSGGGGNPAGAEGAVQFNNAGVFGGGFIYDDAADTTTFGGLLSSSSGSNLMIVEFNTGTFNQTHMGAINSTFNDNGNGGFYQFDYARGTTASPAIVQINDKIGSFVFRGMNSFGPTYRAAAAIDVLVDADPATSGDVTDMPGRIALSTTPDGEQIPAERVRIDNQGMTRIIGGCFSRQAPVTKTADFTVATTENWLINNKVGSTCTVTLPAAAAFTGREIMFNNYQAQTVVSASANVVQQTGASTTSAILAATAGKWATLVSNGTNWVIMQSGG